MSFFIGGDTSSLTYSFDLATAGDASYPVKLYTAPTGIDINNPPSPFTYPSTISDFNGKVSGSTTENPNIAKWSVSSASLLSPSGSWSGELGTGSYTNISKLNDTPLENSSTTINGNIPQEMFSFNLIAIFERTYGTIPGNTDTASKVEWLKNNTNGFVIKYYGYGSCPSGYKAYLSRYSSTAWVTSTTNTASSPSALTSNPPATDIDSNGMLHFLAYTDASDGVTPSNIYTDYISLTINYKDIGTTIPWWQEITDQKTLDKLKAQNEIPITSTDFTNRTAIWNSKNLVLQTDSQPSVRDDFVGKVSGDTTVNPNIAKIANNSSSLISPSGAWGSEFISMYSSVASLDGSVTSGGTWTASIAGNIPQQLFSFNLIRMLEDKYGSLPCPNDTASKVAWLKQNISKIIASWTGYGVSPLGNKGYLSHWCTLINSWTDIINNVSTSPTQLLLSSYGNVNTNYYNNVINDIDSNGMCNFLAYTDSARSTDSTLLVLTGHGLDNWDIIENTTRSACALINTNTINTNVLAFANSATIAGQIAGDSIDKFHRGISKTAEAGTNSTTIVITNHGLTNTHAHYIKNSTRGNPFAKVTVTDANTLTIVNITNSNAGSFTGQTSGDNIVLYPYLSTQIAEGVTNSTFLGLNAHGLSAGDIIENVTRGNAHVGGIIIINTNSISIPGTISGQIAGDTINKYHNTTAKTAETGTTSTTIKITNHGLSTGDFIYNNTHGGLSKVTVIDSNTLTCQTSITGQVSGDTISEYHLLGTQTANDIVIPSTIYTDYISLDIQLKPTAGYDLLVPSNPRRDSVTNGNYDNIVMAEKVYNSLVSDFTGKISGSITENPNIAYVAWNNSLVAPNTGGYSDQPLYNLIKTLDGSSYPTTTFINAQIPQQLFQFNLISIFEKTYGTIPAIDKVSWLKSNISSLKVDWTGYGTCPSGNVAYLDFWNATSNYYHLANNGLKETYKNTSSSPSLITINSTAPVDNKIDSNGIASYIVYTLSSDGVTASIIYTDYIKITLTFNNGNNAIEYFTNNSVEMAVQTTSKASANLISMDISPVCTALYGASNSALLSSFKTTSSFDIYAQGYGASNNDITNGVNYFVWNGSSWVNLGSNLTNAITKVTCTLNTSSFIQSNNNIYILTVSKYNSTTDVPSQISLDYCTFTIQLNRTPDIISPISIIL